MDYDTIVEKARNELSAELELHFKELNSVQEEAKKHGWNMELIRVKVKSLLQKIDAIEVEHTARMRKLNDESARLVIEEFIRKREQGLLDNVSEIMNIIVEDVRLFAAYKGQLDQ